MRTSRLNCHQYMWLLIAKVRSFTQISCSALWSLWIILEAIPVCGESTPNLSIISRRRSTSFICQKSIRILYRCWSILCIKVTKTSRRPPATVLPRSLSTNIIPQVEKNFCKLFKRKWVKHRTGCSANLSFISVDMLPNICQGSFLRSTLWKSI